MEALVGPFAQLQTTAVVALGRLPTFERRIYATLRAIAGGPGPWRRPRDRELLAAIRARLVKGARDVYVPQLAVALDALRAAGLVVGTAELSFPLEVAPDADLAAVMARCPDVPGHRDRVLWRRVVRVPHEVLAELAASATRSVHQRLLAELVRAQPGASRCRNGFVRLLFGGSRRSAQRGTQRLVALRVLEPVAERMTQAVLRFGPARRLPESWHRVSPRRAGKLAPTPKNVHFGSHVHADPGDAARTAIPRRAPPPPRDALHVEPAELRSVPGWIAVWKRYARAQAISTALPLVTFGATLLYAQRKGRAPGALVRAAAARGIWFGSGADEERARQWVAAHKRTLACPADRTALSGPQESSLGAVVHSVLAGLVA